MSIPNRTVSITGVFAESALTTIPVTPISGTSYRDTAMTSTAVRNGWAYKTIVDSSQFNQAMYEYSSITSQIEKYGFLPWSSSTDYVQGSLCLGSNGVIYQAKQATGPSSTAYDPVNDSNHTYWDDFVGSTYVTLATAQTISGNKTFSGTVKAPTVSATDSSTNVATTAWVAGHRCTTKATTSSTASVNSPAYIIQNYCNGKDWYRVWSDGWIEQGGETSASTGKATVTFLKPFANTNYTIISSCNTDSDTGGVAEATAINTADKTTTGVTISQNSSSIRTSSWVAFGY